MEFHHCKEDMRFYDTPIGKLPSVTTILNIIDKPGLRLWYGKHGNEQAKMMLEAAAARGTAVHGYVQQAVNKLEVPVLPQEQVGYVSSWLKWWKRAGLETKMSEQMVWSEDGFAGTLDFLGLDKQGIWRLLDWKTSSAFYVSNVLQLAAYMTAAYQRGLIPREAVCIPAVIRLDVDGKEAEELRIPKFEDVTRFYDVFLHAKELWQTSKDWKSSCEKVRLQKASRKSKPAASSPKSTCQGPFCACVVNGQPCGENTSMTIG